MGSMYNALVAEDWSSDYLYNNKNYGWFLHQYDRQIRQFKTLIFSVINDSHGSNNDYRHVIIKGQHLLKEHFVTDLLFKQDEIERFSGSICTPKMHIRKPLLMFTRVSIIHHVTRNHCA